MNAGSIVATLKLKVDDFSRGIQQAQSKLTEFNNKTKNTAADLRAVGTGMVAGGTAIAVGLGGAVKSAASFEKQMSTVKAISGATGKDFEALRNKAKELGATTAFSATEAAQGMEYLALAGWDTSQIIDGMPGMLNLAAAGGLDLARAADIVSDTMTSFGLKAELAGHAADVFAYAQSNANTNVEQLGEAMKYIAPVANTFGWSLEGTTAGMMALADSGIKGSMAGQAFASSLGRLAKPTREMKNAMKDMNVEFFNAKGELKPLPELIAELEKGTKGMTDQQKSAALTTLFGAEAYKHWAILLERGSEDLAKMTTELERSDGTAKDMAETMLDNLHGALTLLSSAMEGLAISVGEVLLPYLTALVRWLTSLVDWFNGLSDGVKKFIILGAALTSVLLVVGGSFLMFLGFLPFIINGFNQFLTVVKLIPVAMAKMLPMFKAVGSAAIWLFTNPFGIALLAIGALVAGFILWQQHGDAIVAKLAEWGISVEGFTNFITMLKDKIAELWAKFQQTEIFELLANGVGMLKDKFFELWEAIQNLITTGDFTPLLERVQTLIPTILGILIGGLPRLLIMGMTMLTNLADGMGVTVPQLIEKVTEIVIQLITKFVEMLPMFLETGVSILISIIEGIISMLPSIIETATNVITTLLNAVATMLPMILEAGVKILLMLIEGILSILPQLIETAAKLITTIAQKLIQLLPQIIEAGIKILLALIKGIISILPQLIETGIKLIVAIVGAISKMLPSILEAGIRILVTLINGIISILPQLISTAVKLVLAIFKALISNLPMILSAGVQLILALIDGIISVIGSVISAAGSIGKAILDTLGSISLVEIGKDLIRGLWNGISDMAGWIGEKIKGFGDGVLSKLKSFFGIHSPSRVFRDEIGVNLMKGLQVGIDKMQKAPINSVNDMAEKVLNGAKNVTDGFKDLSGIHIATPNVDMGTVGIVYEGNFDRGEGNGGGTNYNAPLIQVESMNVRDESDIRSVSRELFNLQRSHDRSQGGR